MSRRVMIAIGVDQAYRMPKLSGAASGATKMAEWARHNGFEFNLFTDARNQKVSQSDIFQVISRLVDDGDVSHLCIYFAGHSYLPSPDNEVRYLSDAPKLWTFG